MLNNGAGRFEAVYNVAAVMSTVLGFGHRLRERIQIRSPAHPGEPGEVSVLETLCRLRPKGECRLETLR